MPRYHPDKNKDEGAEEKFVQIAQGMSSQRFEGLRALTLSVAYEVLSDPTVSSLVS